MAWKSCWMSSDNFTRPVPKTKFSLLREPFKVLLPHSCWYDLLQLLCVTKQTILRQQSCNHCRTNFSQHQYDLLLKISCGLLQKLLWPLNLHFIWFTSLIELILYIYNYRCWKYVKDIVSQCPYSTKDISDQKFLVHLLFVHVYVFHALFPF